MPTLTRIQLDGILASYCQILGIEFSTDHDEAFCVRHKEDHWLFIWYENDENILSHFIREIDNLFDANVLKLTK